MNLLPNPKYFNCIDDNIRWFKINNHKDFILSETNNHKYLNVEICSYKYRIFLPYAWNIYDTDEKIYDHIKNIDWYLNNNGIIKLYNYSFFLQHVILDYNEETDYIIYEEQFNYN